MAQLVVSDIPDEIVQALESRAAQHGRSVETEHRLILEEALKTKASDFWALADRLRSETRRQKTDGGTLQRQMRDER